MAYLPNKKIFFLLIFILLIFAGWFVFGKSEKNGLKYIAKENSVDQSALEVAARKTLAVDSDNDGLQDWEEALWKTDPKNSDTDNDGTPDGEEVNLDRNPLKLGPDDKISAIPADNSVEAGGLEQNSGSLTDAYAKKFLTDYLTLKNQKGTLSEADKENLITSFTENILATPAEAADAYTVSDIRTSKDNSENATREYSKEVKKIFIEEAYGPENELTIFEHLIRSVNNKEANSEDAGKLNAISKVYGTAAGKMLLIKVPDSMVNVHIEIINSLNNVKLAIKDMAGLSSDPIKSMAGMKIYQKEIQRVYDAMQNLQSVSGKYGISVF